MSLAGLMRSTAQTLAVQAVHGAVTDEAAAELARTLTEWSDRVEHLEEERDQLATALRQKTRSLARIRKALRAPLTRHALCDLGLA